MEATKKHTYPIGYWICCLTYTFERFAFYGSKPLLAIFLATAVAEGGIGLSKADKLSYRSIINIFNLRFTISRWMDL